MYKIAILGCENSHADNFLKAVIREKIVDDVEFVGVYSNEPEAAAKLNQEYGVPVGESYDSFVGKVDGIIITARHGDNHYKYAKPYLDSHIPIFIDKPITCTEEDARAFMKELKERQIPISGGSVCVLDDDVQTLKNAVATEKYGKTLGGYLRAPVMMGSPYGGFFFYSQHLVQTMCEIFGYYPKAVRACATGDSVSCVFRYEGFDVLGQYTDNGAVYSAAVSFDTSVEGGQFDLEGVTTLEFHEFYDLLKGEPQQQSYEDLFQPVFILNATYRAIESGKEEPIGTI